MSLIDPVWYKAMNLAERVATLHTTRDASLPALEQESQLFAEKRMKQWRSLPPFQKEGYFKQRLDQDSVTEDEFLFILGQSEEAISQYFDQPPDWLYDCMQTLCHSFSEQSACSKLLEHIQDQTTRAFLTILTPFLDQALGCFNKDLQILSQSYTHVPFELQAVEQACITNLAPSLSTIISRTLALEINVARLQGTLKGETVQERFQYFIHRLSQRDEALALFKEYPVLIRSVLTYLRTSFSVMLEFFQRLCDDWEMLCRTFSPQQRPGTLCDFTSNAGDQHGGGHAVMLLTFSSGLRLVYKPKALAVDIHFQQLLQWLNERNEHFQFYITKIVDCGAYGWSEFIPYQGCTTTEEVQQFYQRQGGYLTLLYALAATDFHFENIIAMGSQPVLIDLESLFQAYFHNMREYFADGTDIAGQRLSESVLRVGMLPERSWGNAELAGIDLSGLHAPEGQLSPRKSQYWENKGTDTMRIERKQMVIGAMQNIPTLNGERVYILDYSESLIKGFTQMYQLLLQQQENLCADDGPLRWFADDKVRVILRHTHIYSLLLRESYHPNVLRDALARERFFDKLWVSVEKFPELAQVIASERADLWRGDIPIFFTHPSSRAIWNSVGKRIDDFLDEPGLDVVRRRLQSFNPEDLRWQLWLIRSSFTTLSMSHNSQHMPRYTLPETSSSASATDFLEAACAIGDRLESLVLCDGQAVSWIGLRAFREQYWEITPLRLDLYNGLPGVVLFLAYLGILTQEKRYTRLAHMALANLQFQLGKETEVLPIGAFTGYGGLIYVLTHLGVLWNKADLLIQAEGLVSKLPDLIPHDKHFDVISGAAGCIGALSCLYSKRPSREVLATMHQCGLHLLQYAQQMSSGHGWVTPLAQQPLTGFSHGAAGIAWALLKLTTLTGEQRFHDAASQALAYERKHFSEEAQNWLDLREEANTPSYTSAWCHGAAGIGLARLATLPYLDTPEIRKEIQAAVHTTLQTGFGHNHSLCHGDLGNLELLLQASCTLATPQIQAHFERTASVVLKSISEYGYLCGVPLGVENPGLMAGLAGIGYGLLRLAEPGVVPSVLVLDPPTFKG